MKKNTKTFLSLAAAGAFATAVMTAPEAMAEGKEKCYGVVKAGKNDCGAPGHSCAGHATKDADGKEWVYVPEGLCDRLANGSKEPKEG